MNIFELGIKIRPDEWFGGMEKHHIVHKGQMGCDYDLNFIMLPAAFHKGPNGPHLNKATDELFRKVMQKELEELFVEEFYELEEVVALLRPWNKESRIEMENRIKKNNTWTPKGYPTEGIIRALMGGKMEVE